MNTELVIQSAKESINIVVLKDGRLMELHQLPLNKGICSVFDIYLARVRRIASSLNAAFLDMGQDKDAFLHYHDLGPKFRSFKKFTKKSIEKKINKLGSMHSRGFDWIEWEILEEDLANNVSQLSIHKNIVKGVLSRYD